MAETQLVNFRFSPVLIELVDVLRHRLCDTRKSRTAFVKALIHRYAFGQLMAAIERGDVPQSVLDEPMDNRDPDAAMLVLMQRIAEKVMPEPTSPTLQQCLDQQGWTNN